MMGNTRASVCGMSNRMALTLLFYKLFPYANEGARLRHSLMARTSFLFLFALIAFFTFPCIAKESIENMDYSIEGAATGTQGTYLVKVSVLSKNRNLSDRDLILCAIKGVLFQGFSDPTSRVTQKPLAGNAANEASHASFYKEFFGDNGSAHHYGSVISGSRSVVKCDKKYKVSCTVSVKKEELLRYLHEAGVVNSLNSIF